MANCAGVLSRTTHIIRTGAREAARLQIFYLESCKRMPYTLGSEIHAGIVRANKVFADTTVELPTDTSIGTVTSTELGHLSGVTSSVQTQINGKQDTIQHYLVDLRLGTLPGGNTSAYLIKDQSLTELQYWVHKHSNLTQTEADTIGVSLNDLVDNDDHWKCPKTGMYHMVVGTFATASQGDAVRNFSLRIEKEVSANTWQFVQKYDHALQAYPGPPIDQGQLVPITTAPDDDLHIITPVMSHYVFCEQNDKFRITAICYLTSSSVTLSLYKNDHTYWQIRRHA